MQCVFHSLRSDELYANSLFDRKRDFLSLGYVWQHNKEVLPQGAHNLVHVINGISKDWALAGLRLGFLVSWNTRLLTAYNNPVSVPQTGKLGTYTRASSSVFCAAVIL